MPSGHTDRATINQRRPLTELMKNVRDDIERAEKAGRPLRFDGMQRAEKNAARALMDRGLVTFEPSGECVMVRN